MPHARRGGSPTWNEPGPTVLAAMSADSEHFGGSAQSWSINFRVIDLDAMVTQLREASITVDIDPATYANGRFATMRDPEVSVRPEPHLPPPR